jgi:hypothetical protein
MPSLQTRACYFASHGARWAIPGCSSCTLRSLYRFTGGEQVVANLAGEQVDRAVDQAGIAADERAHDGQLDAVTLPVVLMDPRSLFQHAEKGIL